MLARLCGDQPLQLTFLVLYEITINREASIELSLARQGLGERKSWDVRFTQDVNDWELDLVVDFLRNPILLQLKMGITWDGSWRKMVILISNRFIISCKPSLCVFPWKDICKVKAPRWVSFFVWTIAWDKILTGDNLRIRGFTFVDWCVMCHCCGESVDHLLLHYAKAHWL